MRTRKILTNCRYSYCPKFKHIKLYTCLQCLVILQLQSPSPKILNVLKIKAYNTVMFIFLSSINCSDGQQSINQSINKHTQLFSFTNKNTIMYVFFYKQNKCYSKFTRHYSTPIIVTVPCHHSAATSCCLVHI